MIAAPARLRTSFRPAVPMELVGVVVCGMAMLVAAAAVALLGPWALSIPLYLGLIIGAIVAPRPAAFVTLGLMVGFEPGAIDFTRPVSMALYSMPPGFEHVLPLTMTPIEVVTSLLFVSLVLRGGTKEPRSALPMLAIGLPIVFAMGLAYGLRKGGDIQIGYEESRGLVMAALTFVIVRRLWSADAKGLTVATFAGTTVLAVIVLLRYMFITRSGTSGIPNEFAYAHEDAVFLAIGFVIGGLMLMRSPAGRERALLVMYELTMLAALVTTGRRAGTLVLVVGVMVAAWFLFKRRPGMVLAAGIPLLLFSTVYVGAYWNKEYGAIAQPARAIRSQISPSARDESSDTYRTTEKYDVLQTIRGNRIFGVGIGRPFATYQPLPSLTSFWPLQLYTPHANVMWLWLKFGLFGASAFLGLWAITLSRCMRHFRLAVAHRELPIMPIAVAVVLVMYLSYAQVDQAFPGSRSTIPLAIAMAIGLSLRAKAPAADATGASE